MRPSDPARRRLLRGLGAAGAAALSGCASFAQRPRHLAPAAIRVDHSTPVVTTGSGAVRGFIQDAVHCFRGIPYARAERFCPPGPAAAWTGIRDCLIYGPVCPQPARWDWNLPALAFIYDWDDGYPGEDCLSLNLWTPRIPSDQAALRPVLLWLHGGGFQAGSSHELAAYDGTSLAASGDLVVVSINHRLGALGFLDLSSVAPEQFPHSGNAGMLDIVAALRWVRDNIAAFGGDPANVTVAGHSGGGYKIATLMVMPQAAGLFHKAIIASGSQPRLGEPEDAARITMQTLKLLDLDPARAAELARLPVDRLIDAANRARKAVQAELQADALRIRWQPVVDGRIVPAHPESLEANRRCASVPLLLGTTEHEWNPAFARPELYAMTPDEALERLRRLVGDHAAEVDEAYRQFRPAAVPDERVALAVSARTAAIAQATRHHALRGASVFMYWFGWRTPILDGRPLAFHGADLPFWFANTDRCANMTGGGARPLALAQAMSRAWARFAWTGSPAHSGLPAWTPFEPEQRMTLWLDDRSRCVPDPDAVPRSRLEMSLI